MPVPLFDEDPPLPHAPSIRTVAAESATAEETRMGDPFRDHARRSEYAGAEASDARQRRVVRRSRSGHDRALRAAQGPGDTQSRLQVGMPWTESARMPWTRDP